MPILEKEITTKGVFQKEGMAPGEKKRSARRRDRTTNKGYVQKYK